MMGFIKQRYVLTLIGLLTAPHLFAANISFLVVETGLREGGPVNESSSLWETGLLDVFFDAGHIVSNAPIKSLPDRPNGEIPEKVRGDMEEAVRGGANFFILALLDYHDSAAAGTASKISPREVSLRLFRTNPWQLVYEQVYAPRGREAGGNELVRVKQLIRSLVPYVEIPDE